MCVCDLLSSTLIFCLSPVSNPSLPPIVGAVTWWELSNLSVTELGCYDGWCRRDTKKVRKAGLEAEKWSECLRAETSLVGSNAASGRHRKNVLSILRGLQGCQLSACLWAPIPSLWAQQDSLRETNAAAWMSWLKPWCALTPRVTFFVM